MPTLKRTITFDARIKNVERRTPVIHTAKDGTETLGEPQWEITLDIGAKIIVYEDLGLSPGPVTLTLTQTEKEPSR